MGKYILEFPFYLLFCFSNRFKEEFLNNEKGVQCTYTVHCTLYTVQDKSETNWCYFYFYSMFLLILMISKASFWDPWKAAKVNRSFSAIA